MEMVLKHTKLLVIMLLFAGCNNNKENLTGIWERCPVPPIKIFEGIEYPFNRKTPHVSCERIYISNQFIEYPNFMTGQNLENNNFISYIPYELRKNKININGKEFEYILSNNSSKICIIDMEGVKNCFYRKISKEDEKKELVKIELSYNDSFDENTNPTKVIIENNNLQLIDAENNISTVDLSLSEKKFLEKIAKRCKPNWGCVLYNHSFSDATKYELIVTFKNDKGKFGTCATTYGLGLDLPFDICALILGVLSLEELYIGG